MKRFALATMLMAIMGLNMGCADTATDDPAPEVEAPAVEVDEVEEVETTDETPAE